MYGPTVSRAHPSDQRTLVYGSLSLILAALYFSLVLAAQAVSERLSGQGEPGIVLVNPLRHRLQTVVDRRFYRSKYDAARTLEVFGETLRAETNVRETMQPASVSLWLREASTTPRDEWAGGSDLRRVGWRRMAEVWLAVPSETTAGCGETSIPRFTVGKRRCTCLL